MNTNQTLGVKLIRKIAAAFFLLVIVMGISYVFITLFFTNKHFEERSQRLNKDVAKHLIEEKFLGNSPFLEDGKVNKALFGDLMHDMMAVNRGIEVYLLDDSGEILYSVVLSHDNPEDPTRFVDIRPIEAFIECDGDRYILGDDPRNASKKKIFSAAPFDMDGRKGYIYIVLAGEAFESVADSLATSYFMRLGIGASILTMLFVTGLGLLSFWFLMKNLRSIIQTVKRFREGDMTIRIDKPEQSDLSVLALNFNEMADTIEKNIDEIKSVDVLRRELIANVSHDLRTPLSIILGYIETLQIKNEELSQEDKDNYLEIIKGSSQKLSHLVSQLFEYSKLEAKQIQPVKEPFAITELAMDLVSKYSLIAESKGISVEVDMEENIPMVFADIGLVERAMQNLLDNAIKFVPEKGLIKLNISADSSNVKVGVQDNGPGINKNDQEFIFDRYRRSANTKKSEGAGLGLAIVRKIMELHNTTIRVISKPNEGSTFEFSLPSYSV